MSAAPDEVMLELTEEVNAYAEDLHHAHSDQLGYFASLPLPLVDESIRMIDHALDEQHALGFTLPTNARGIYLGDDPFRPSVSEIE